MKDTRDMIGYGANPPHPKWPNKARIAVQFVINYEEGAETRFLDYIQSKDQVWITRRIDIAKHWKEHFPAKK